MMSSELPSPAAPTDQAGPSRPGWKDLVIYLLGGFGLYMVVSLLLALAFHSLTIWASFALYLANGLCLGGSVYVLGVLRRKTDWQSMGFLPVNWHWSWVLIAVILVAVFLPLRGLLGLLVEKLLGGSLASLQTRSDLILVGNQFSVLNFMLTFLGVGVIAPISEELYFRGLLHRWFIGWTKPWQRTLASSLLFGLAHFDSIPVAVSAFVMGAVNAVVYERSKTLWIPILTHMITNMIGVVLLYLVLGLKTYLNLPM
ncbi:MAG: type II CAAX endopeptidase family protein [Anaerolineaceae bacterium]|jgi:membrane protease YdiL (CAAX protease family)